MTPRCYRHSWGHPAPQRARDRDRAGSKPDSGTGIHWGPTPGLRRSGLAGRWHPGPPTPRAALPLPWRPGGRPTGREGSGFSYATGPPRSWATPSGARLRCRRWPAPVPFVAGGARGWIPLPSMMPSSPGDRPQKSDSGGHFDLNLLEATPGIEPGIAVLQIPRIRLGPSAGVRFEIKNGPIRPLRCACGRRSSSGLGSKLGSRWAGCQRHPTPTRPAHQPCGLVGPESPIRIRDGTVFGPSSVDGTGGSFETGGGHRTCLVERDRPRAGNSAPVRRGLSTPQPRHLPLLSGKAGEPGGRRGRNRRRVHEGLLRLLESPTRVRRGPAVAISDRRERR